ncbi:ABC transporter permease subunit [Devosia nitrariae]|uniref:Sugar ABC transporter permease n=1 Tax=Devosia nitrariae TaxID=2071872 RepID=A0ABQ5WAC0_9HYPH|nr:ABC transporter permease subunit [Devosia nitrariae]GLQ57013.1 sugar ABC transporter permease [Devosia nitrariae]
MDNRISLDRPVVKKGATPTSIRLRAMLGRDWKIAALFVLPVVLLMAGLIFWPFINAILMSTTTFSFVTGETVGVGLRNYERLFTNSDYLLSLQNTINFTIWSLAIKFVAGMTIALILHSRLPYRNLLSAIMLLPWIVPEVVTALAWKSIYDPLFGGLNPILQGLGVIDRPLGWLSDPNMALGSVIAVNVWKGIPFYTLLLLAGLKAIDNELFEAAEVDGASAVQRFRYVTLPGMRYVILVVLLLSFISTFNQFGLIFLMTGGGPGGATRLYSILAYEKAIGSLQYGPGSAIALSVAPLMAFLIYLLAKFMRHDDRASINKAPGIGTRIGKLFGRAFSLILDIVFWPFEMINRGLEATARAIRRRVTGSPVLPVLEPRQREKAGIGVRLLILLPIMVFVLFPFYWVVITSFKTTPQISQRSSIFWPDPATLGQYQALITQSPFLVWLGNSLLVAAVSTLVSVVVAALAAYALSRLKFVGAGLLTTAILITYLLPGTLIFIPLYQTLSDLGLINSYGALMVTYPTFLVPFATWVLIGYFRSIPVELEEAAMIDGASRFYAFWRITLPLAAPALLAVALFAFTNAWNEFLFAFVFINSESLRTLPIGLQSMVVGDILPWGQLMAASLLTAVPVALLYMYAQRFLVGGLTVGAVKG